MNAYALLSALRTLDCAVIDPAPGEAHAQYGRRDREVPEFHCSTVVRAAGQLALIICNLIAAAPPESA